MYNIISAIVFCMFVQSQETHILVILCEWGSMYDPLDREDPVIDDEPAYIHKLNLNLQP